MSGEVGFTEHKFLGIPQHKAEGSTFTVKAGKFCGLNYKFCGLRAMHKKYVGRDHVNSGTNNSQLFQFAESRKFISVSKV